MSMALPTVVFDTPVSKEFLGHYGIYAQEYTADGLAVALEQALNIPPQTRKQVGGLLRQWAITHYSWKKTGQQIELVYGAVLAGHPQPAFVVKQAIV